MNILLTEDCPVTTRFIQSILQGSNLECIAARTAAQAIGVLEGRSDIALLVTDLLLPDSTGLDLISQVRTMPPYREVPVIIITAQSNKESVMKAASFGVQGFFRKPFSGRSFVSRVKEILAGIPLVLATKQTVILDLDISPHVYDAMLASFGEQLQSTLALLETCGTAEAISSHDLKVLLSSLHESARLLGAERLQKVLSQLRLDENLSLDGDAVALLTPELKRLCTPLPCPAPPAEEVAPSQPEDPPPTQAVEQSHR